MESAAPATPILIYDGNCAFCQKWIDHWRRLTGDRIRYAPFQEVESQYPQISHQTFERGVQLVMPGGTVTKNAQAVYTVVSETPRRGWLLWAYKHVPGFAPASELGYRLIGSHRDFGYWITQILWGDLGPHTYVLTRWLFLRLLGVIYFIAFASLSVQIIGLVGNGGILSISSLMARAGQSYQGSLDGYLALPSLTWINSSDAMLRFLCYGGMALSALLILDILAAPVMALIYVFYLSLVVAGQTFMTFQWDVLLLETGFLAIFLAGIDLIPRLRNRRQPSLVVIYLFRWLIFRLMLSSGLVKLLSGDPNWRNLTALDYHYWTQPIPTPLAWYFAQAPEWFLKFSVAFTFFVELIVPFLFWMPRRIRFVGATFTILLQLMIIVTGNYTYFNWLTIVLCIPLLDDQFLRHFIPRRIAAPLIDTARKPGRSWPKRIGLALLTIFIVTITGYRFFPLIFPNVNSGNLPEPLARVVYSSYRLRMAGGYGLFANMTTARPEIIVEGSNDGQTWLPYEFYDKVGDVNRPPPWVAPHQPRLDWQMWFAALGGTYEGADWFPAFAHRLLQGAPDVLALIEKNPFPDAPPKYLRAEVMNYRFTTVSERNQTGAWWKHGPPREYLPVITLNSFGPPRP